ncbi:RNA polymerase sigma factor [Loigolactobacillus binensis]|uniref:RNA polymerase sigma factor n=1 Tax=Loigolactobacillus binensis TaxID=2559922 RepID=A0ABW3EEA8_9LACO|nr:RNA polymerase sigma factor [Loigolactobacillus binensis]
MISDEVLFELVARADDQQAFETLVRKYRLPAINYVTKLIHDRDYAQNLTQNVFANIYFKRQAIYPVASFKFYLFKALKYQAIDWIRKTKRVATVDIDNFTLSFEQVNASDYLQVLQQELTPTDYQLAILRFYYGFTFKEIAQLMTITAGNARVRCSRLRWKLRHEPFWQQALEK